MAANPSHVQHLPVVLTLRAARWLLGVGVIVGAPGSVPAAARGASSTVTTWPAVRVSPNRDANTFRLDAQRSWATSFDNNFITKTCAWRIAEAK